MNSIIFMPRVKLSFLCVVVVSGKVDLNSFSQFRKTIYSVTLFFWRCIGIQVQFLSRFHIVWNVPCFDPKYTLCSTNERKSLEARVILQK